MSETGTSTIMPMEPSLTTGQALIAVGRDDETLLWKNDSVATPQRLKRKIPKMANYEPPCHYPSREHKNGTRSNPYPHTKRRQWRSYGYPKSAVISDTHKTLTVLLLALSVILLQLPVSEAVTSTPDNSNNPSSASLSSTTTAGLGIPTTGTTSTNPISPLGIADNDQQEASSAAPTTTAKKKTKKNLLKKKSTNKPPSTKKTTGSSLSGSKAMFIQRVQREWKDAVQMGIAYDWLKQKPVMTKKSKRKQQLAKLQKEQQPPTNLAFVSTTATATTSNTELPQEQRAHYLCLGPLGKNLFVWHFSFLGLEGSDFEGGLYHGRIVLPTNYPMSPPRVQVWTPSGRFIPRADICLSASAFHPESWNPAAYNLRTIVESLRLHMLTHAMEIGGTNATPKKRRALALESRSWKQGFIEKKNSQRFWVDHALLTEQGVFAAAVVAVGNDTTDNTTATCTEATTDTEAETMDTASAITKPTITSDPAIIPTSSVATTKVKQKKSKAKRKNKNKTKKHHTHGTAVKRKQEPGLLIRFVQALIDNRSLLVALLVVYVYFSIVNRSNPIIVVV